MHASPCNVFTVMCVCTRAHVLSGQVESHRCVGVLAIELYVLFREWNCCILASTPRSCLQTKLGTFAKLYQRHFILCHRSINNKIVKCWGGGGGILLRVKYESGMYAQRLRARLVSLLISTLPHPSNCNWVNCDPDWPMRIKYIPFST